MQADNEIGEKRKEIFLTVNYKPRCDCQKKMMLKRFNDQRKNYLQRDLDL